MGDETKTYGQKLIGWNGSGNCGSGTRVDAVFVIQQGQVASESYIRDALCRVISGAQG